MHDAAWLPSITFRRSLRAKRLALRLDPVRGLEVVLPRRASEKQGLAFLHAQRAWVEKHLPKLDLHQQPELPALPDCVSLSCIDQIIPIEYIPVKAAKRVSLSARDDRLFFFGNISNFKPCVPLMTTWIKEQAKLHLPLMVHEVSSVCGLAYSKVSVRGQKTRWGSCTADKSIQLNYKLLLLPESVVRYVMLHELCHTVHLNHSEAFWALVKTHMPDYQIQERALKQAGQCLPGWLLW